jgi:hypothetical protein
MRLAGVPVAFRIAAVNHGINAMEPQPDNGVPPVELIRRAQEVLQKAHTVGSRIRARVQQVVNAEDPPTLAGAAGKDAHYLSPFLKGFILSLLTRAKRQTTPSP